MTSESVNATTAHDLIFSDTGLSSSEASERLRRNVENHDQARHCRPSWVLTDDSFAANAIVLGLTLVKLEKKLCNLRPQS